MALPRLFPLDVLEIGHSSLSAFGQAEIPHPAALFRSQRDLMFFLSRKSLVSSEQLRGILVTPDFILKS